MEQLLIDFSFRFRLFGPLVAVLVLALVLDAVFGDFPWLFRHIGHPVVWVGNLIVWFERRLNKAGLSDADRFLRGTVTSLR